MMWWNGGAGWAGWLIMSVAMVGFWLLVFVAIIALIPGGRGDSSDGLRGVGQGAPLRDLDDRLSRGEINLQDYKVARARLIDSRQGVVTHPDSPEAAPTHLKGLTR